MATQKQNKKDSNLIDLFAKTQAKKQDPTRELGSDPEGGNSDGTVEEDANPVANVFMEQLFGFLQEDLAALRQELATTVKELKGEGTGLGQRVKTVERICERQEEELDHHRQKIITLQDSNRDLQYGREDLENRSWRSNIRIRGVPVQDIVGPLEGFVIRLFKHMAPVLDDQDIILDCTHRTVRPSQRVHRRQEKEPSNSLVPAREEAITTPHEATPP
ncbi:hypothetical protein NDU88_004806 [Pleurodeles waltl]|uniref:Uncharacterized protein n=1 Tax=Pleurodeles waltl TaxID=8319 RepID=A0AAV7T9F7_PLEWA|nr:hypothetical protein NDU88_004806 [Pleurodeles waltl]